MDILNTPLSHITGEAVVEGDIRAIANLLDILSGLMEYLLDKIGSDISTDNDGTFNADFLTIKTCQLISAKLHLLC